MVAIKKLTAAFVASCKEPGRYADGGNLYLQVTEKHGAAKEPSSEPKSEPAEVTVKPPVTKAWLFRYQIGGRCRAMGLGSVGTYSLAEARERARKARQMVDDGVDPIEKRDEGLAQKRAREVQRLTFRQCAERFIAAHAKKWSPKQEKEWSASLATYAYPTLGKLAVDRIETQHVIETLEPHWQAKTNAMTKLRGRIEQILDYAATRHLRPAGVPNPARWKGHLDKVLPAKREITKVEHLAAMPYREVPAFIARRRDPPGPGFEIELGPCGVERLAGTRGAERRQFERPCREALDALERLQDVEHARRMGQRLARLAAREDEVLASDSRESLKQAHHLVGQGNDVLDARLHSSASQDART
jgi:hypothetical protein